MGFDYNLAGGQAGILVTHKDGLLSTLDSNTLSLIKVVFIWQPGLPPNLNVGGINNTMAKIRPGVEKAKKLLERKKAQDALQASLPEVQEEVTNYLANHEEYAGLGIRAEWKDSRIEIVNDAHPELSFQYVPKSRLNNELQRFGEALLDYGDFLETLGQEGRITEKNDGGVVVDGNMVAFESGYKTVVKQLGKAVAPEKHRTARIAAEKAVVQEQQERAIATSIQRQERREEKRELSEEPVLLVMDAGPLIDLSAQRGESKNGKSWLDLLEMTSELPNITVVVPAQVANLEARGMLEEWSAGGEVKARTVNTSFEAPPKGLQQRHAMARRLTALFEKAYRARLNANGEVEILPPKTGHGNPHLIVWETNDCHRIRQDISRTHSLHDHLGQNEGEQAIARFLCKENPFDCPAIVISEDLNFSQGESPKQTRTGKPIGYAGVADYLDAELSERPNIISAQLGMPRGKVKLSAAIHDIVDHRNLGEEQLREHIERTGNGKSNGFRSSKRYALHESVGQGANGKEALCLQEVIRANVNRQGSGVAPVNFLQPLLQEQDLRLPVATGDKDSLAMLMSQLMQDVRMDAETLAERINDINRTRHGKKRDDIISVQEVRQILHGDICPSERQMSAIIVALVTENTRLDERWRAQHEHSMLDGFRQRQAAGIPMAEEPDSLPSGEPASLGKLLANAAKKVAVEELLESMNEANGHIARPGNYTLDDVRAVLNDEAPANAEFVMRFLRAADHCRTHHKAPRVPDATREKIFLALAEEQCRAVTLKTGNGTFIEGV